MSEQEVYLCRGIEYKEGEKLIAAISTGQTSLSGVWKNAPRSVKYRKERYYFRYVEKTLRDPDSLPFYFVATLSDIQVRFGISVYEGFQLKAEDEKINERLEEWLEAVKLSPPKEHKRSQLKILEDYIFDK